MQVVILLFRRQSVLACVVDIVADVVVFVLLDHVLHLGIRFLEDANLVANFVELIIDLLRGDHPTVLLKRLELPRVVARWRTISQAVLSHWWVLDVGLVPWK